MPTLNIFIGYKKSQKQEDLNSYEC